MDATEETSGSDPQSGDQGITAISWLRFSLQSARK